MSKNCPKIVLQLCLLNRVYTNIPKLFELIDLQD